MIEVNWSLIKSWSKTESITAIYMSNKSGSWKQSASTQIYINLVHPLLILYSIYTCAKEFNTTNQRMKSLNTPGPNICLANISNLTGSHIFFLPLLSRRVEGRNLAGNDSTHHPLLAALRIWVTYFESKLWCSWTDKYHILEAKQHCPKQRRGPAVQTGILILICGIAIHTKARHWGLVKHGTSQAQLLPILFECNMTEATRMSKRKWWISEIRQISIASRQEAKGRTKGRVVGKYWQQVNGNFQLGLESNEETETVWFHRFL